MGRRARASGRREFGHMEHNPCRAASAAGDVYARGPEDALQGRLARGRPKSRLLIDGRPQASARPPGSGPRLSIRVVATSSVSVSLSLSGRRNSPFALGSIESSGARGKPSSVTNWSSPSGASQDARGHLVEGVPPENGRDSRVKASDRGPSSDSFPACVSFIPGPATFSCRWPRCRVRIAGAAGG